MYPESGRVSERRRVGERERDREIPACLIPLRAHKLGHGTNDTYIHGTLETHLSQPSEHITYMYVCMYVCKNRQYIFTGPCVLRLDVGESDGCPPSLEFEFLE